MKYRLILILMLMGVFSFAQDLSLHKTQLESLLKKMSLNPQWDDAKNNLSFEYKNQSFNATFYAKRLVETDNYTVFLSIQCETGIKTDYMKGIYAINHASDDFYTVKGYLDGFDPEKAELTEKYPLMASADLLMSSPTSLNENTLSWTLKVMKNVSDDMKSSTDTGSVEEKPKKKEQSTTAVASTPKEEKTVEANSANEENEEPTLSEKEQKRSNRKKRARNTLNQLMNSL